MRLGRPHMDKAKTVHTSIRIDQDFNQKLEKYCEENRITKGEAYRRGIELLLSKGEENGNKGQQLEKYNKTR